MQTNKTILFIFLQMWISLNVHAQNGKTSYFLLVMIPLVVILNTVWASMNDSRAKENITDLWDLHSICRT